MTGTGSEPEPLTARKMVAYLPTAVLGEDDQGRTIIRDPRCGEDATVQHDGSVTCPLCDGIADFLRGEADRWEAP